MNKLAKGILTKMGADVKEYTSGDVVLSSPTLEKPINPRDSHGSCTRERVQLQATRNAETGQWLVEAFRQRAEFTQTLAYNEVDVVTPIAKTYVGIFSSSFGVAKVFRDHADRMKVFGYGPVRQHQLDIVSADAPKAPVIKIA